jgi:hypothetical protein
MPLRTVEIFHRRFQWRSLPHFTAITAITLKKQSKMKMSTLDLSEKGGLAGRQSKNLIEFANDY